WSSDVCSSDLPTPANLLQAAHVRPREHEPVLQTKSRCLEFGLKPTPVSLVLELHRLLPEALPQLFLDQFSLACRCCVILRRCLRVQCLDRSLLLVCDY